MSSRPSANASVGGFFSSCEQETAALRRELRADEHVVSFLWVGGARAGGIGRCDDLHPCAATASGVDALRRRAGLRVVTDEQAALALRLAPTAPAFRTMSAEDGAMVLAPRPLRTTRIQDGQVPWLAAQLGAMGIAWDWKEALRAAGEVEQADRRRESSSDGRLLAAARDGDLPGVDAALEAGASIDARAPRGRRDRWFPGDTALVAAITGGHVHVVDLLLVRGADPNVEGGVFSPLHTALWCRREELLEQLLRAGADPTRERHRGGLVEQAMRNGSDLAVRMLLAAGAALPDEQRRR